MTCQLVEYLGKQHGENESLEGVVTSILPTGVSTTMLELDFSHVNIGLLYGLFAAYVSSR